MKKLFVGCGLLVVVAAIALFFLLRPLWPAANELMASMEEFHVEMLALDEAHPFDPGAPVDFARFERALAVREQMAPFLHDFESALQTQGTTGEPEQRGVIEQVIHMMGLLRQGIERFEQHLAQADMGPTEFGYHTRLLWAALGTIDAGLADGDPRLDPLRLQWRELKDAYPELVKHDPELPASLSDRVGAFAPTTTAEAREVIAGQPERVLAGLAEPGLEVHFYMDPGKLTTEKVISPGPRPAEPAAAEDPGS